jgi:hypothetical protein
MAKLSRNYCVVILYPKPIFLHVGSILFKNLKAFLHNITPSYIKYNIENEGNETYKLHGFFPYIFLYGNVFGLHEIF